MHIIYEKYKHILRLKNHKYLRDMKLCDMFFL
jgi:hypothetical protein